MPFTPKESLALFKKAVEERGSSVAFGARAVCYTRLAFNESDPHWIQEAMGDIVAAKRIMKNNAEVLGESVIVHYNASILYGQAKNAKESEQAMRIAEEDALALKDFAEVPIAVQARGLFLAELGRNEEAIHWFEECNKRKKLADGPSHRYAWLLYERGDTDKAFQVLEQLPAWPKSKNPCSAIFVAESPDNGLNRALQIAVEIPANRGTDSLLTKPALLFLLGQKSKALDLLTQQQPQPDPREGNTLHARLITYWKNPNATKEKELLDIAGRSKASLVLAHWHIGIRILGEGDRIGARRHFEACVAIHYPYFWGYLESRAMLARMSNDPTWPPWIPLKKDERKP
jgi:tetratricopeptide (TPR) repeat protein